MRATPGNYPHKRMPDQRARLEIDRTFSEPEYRALIHGRIPRSQTDRWFAFEVDDWFSLHRSATGHCIYRVRLEQAADGWRVAEAWANRDPDQYDSTDDEADAQMLGSLLDRVIETNGH
ncbi:MAG: hypothetical protein ACOX9R_05510 [Armatimonadota bacterium]|jgi:hypothetical protein